MNGSLHLGRSITVCYGYYTRLYSKKNASISLVQTKYTEKLEPRRREVGCGKSKESEPRMWRFSGGKLEVGSQNQERVKLEVGS